MPSRFLPHAPTRTLATIRGEELGVAIGRLSRADAAFGHAVMMGFTKATIHEPAARRPVDPVGPALAALLGAVDEVTSRLADPPLGVRVVLCEPGRAPEERRINGDLDSMQRLVKGTLDEIGLGGPFRWFVNEAARRLGLPVNRALAIGNGYSVNVLGPLFAAKTGADGQLISLTDAEVERVMLALGGKPAAVASPAATSRSATSTSRSSSQRSGDLGKRSMATSTVTRSRRVTASMSAPARRRLRAKGGVKS